MATTTEIIKLRDLLRNKRTTCEKFLKESLFEQNDQLETSRYEEVGKIVVECWYAVRTGIKYRHLKYLSFQQASKRDGPQVTKGRYFNSS